MTTQDYQQSLRAYQEAISALYEAPPDVLVERGSTADVATTPDLEVHAETVVERSHDLGQALAACRAAEEAERRELADAQLLAAAALDLQIASDLVRRAEDGVPDTVRERSAGLPSAYRELQAVLAADSAQGISGLVSARRERTAGPTDPRAARDALKDTVKAALEDLRDAAADVGQDAFLGLTNLPLPAVQQVFGVVFSEIMSRLSEGVAVIVRKAITLVAQAVDKILAAIGRDAQDEVRAKLGEWIEDLRSGTLFAALLDRLAETERLRAEVLAQVDAATTADSTRYTAASTRVADLNVKFGKQRELITWVLKGVAWARSWIMPLVPWGPVGLSATYAFTIGYAVYAFADRVDAYRLGGPERLDHLPGVRRIVREELAEGAV